MYKARVGLFGIGVDAYWPQFEGLKSRLEGYLQVVHSRLMLGQRVEVTNLGLVDTPEDAFEFARRFRREDVDVIFMYAAKYTLSSTVLPILQHAKVPVILLDLQPPTAIEDVAFNQVRDRSCSTGEWLARCPACTVPEVASVFRHAGIRFHQITGTLEEDDPAWNEVSSWVDAARVESLMFQNRLGLVGHYFSGMLDKFNYLTLQCATFGGHIEMVEVDELIGYRQQVSHREIESRISHFCEALDVDAECEEEELARAARNSIALDRLVDAHSLGSVAYYHFGAGSPENEDVMSSIVLGGSLLNARGVQVAGEYEVKNVQAMKILDAFGVGGSFAEFYTMDFTNDVVLMGHDGPGNISIAQGRALVRPMQVYHGRVRHGLSVEMSVKHGPVTVLSVVETLAGKLKLLVAEGESVSGPLMEVGNTISRYRFPCGARQFVSQWSELGPAHHCAVGVGHIATKIECLASLLEIEMTQVC